MNEKRPLFRKGDSGPAVAEICDRLVRIGAIEKSSNFIDESIEAAIKKFQQSRGITVDGIVGPETFRRLEEARWSLGDRTLRFTPGHLIHGDDVSSLQRKLTDLGFDSGRVDGIFGKNTESALKEFQKSTGLPNDGICGPEVFKAIERLNRVVVGGSPETFREELHHLPRRTGVSDKVVVIDPGHGGDDPGLTGHNLSEQFISSDIAKKVEGKLAALGTTVLLTRVSKTNEVIDEQQRATFANNSNADLVVSIHTDAIKNPDANGCASYYFGNESLGQKSSMGQRFANLVQTEIVKKVGLNDCRTHAKTWDLLRMTKMPAVRIEVGYLSNTLDAKKLSDAQIRDLIAASIAEAIITFFEPASN